MMLNVIKTKLYKIKRNLSNPNYYKFQILKLIYRNVIDTRYKKNVSSMFNHSPAIFFWFKDNASDLLYDYDLGRDSIVVEVGAHIGDWCVKMYNRFNCKILAYEPVNEYYIQLKKNISQFENIESYNFGLGRINEKIRIKRRGVQTTILNQHEDFDDIIEIKDIASLKGLNNISIDLMNINIEGGEYDLLNRLIETKILHNIYNIQIQFHEWLPSIGESKVLRNNIHNKLKETHKLDYSYDFVWEKWSKKEK